MALEGPLKEFHIQDVFQLLDLGRKSGVLRVTSELRQTAGTVSFERGGVVAATVSGQLVVSTILDQFGFLGLDKVGLTPARLLGFALLLGGTALVTAR